MAQQLPQTRGHTLSMENRQRAVITGVEDVDSFNEQMVMLSTSQGMLTLLGEQLHIANLNLENGQLTVEGQIAALEYDDSVRPGPGRTFARLFK